MIKAILFDFFGTIANKPGKEWFSRHGLSSENEAVRVLFRGHDLGRISPEDVANGLADIAGVSHDGVLDEIRAHAEVKRKMLDLADRLRQQYRVGLLSNAYAGFLREVYGQTSLEERFDPVVISSDVGMVKPEPNIYKYSLNMLDLQAENVVFIDDNESNIETSDSLGFRSVLFKTHHELLEDLSKLSVRL